MDRNDGCVPWGCPIEVGDKRVPISLGPLLLAREVCTSMNTEALQSRLAAPDLRALLGDQMLQWPKDTLE